MNRVITLCGSTRFKDEFEEQNKIFTLGGNVVLSCGVFVHSDGESINEETKAILDAVHLRKIDMSDTIYVLNIDGYIGESTRREIAYARVIGKQIIYHEPI